MFNVFFLLMILAQFIAAASQILLKKSAGRTYGSFIREYLNILVAGGYALLLVSMVIVIFCYDGLGYMGAVVMEPISYIIVMLLSRLVFAEKLTRAKLIGMGLIVCGIAVFYLFG